MCMCTECVDRSGISITSKTNQKTVSIMQMTSRQHTKEMAGVAWQQLLVNYNPKSCIPSLTHNAMQPCSSKLLKHLCFLNLASTSSIKRHCSTGLHWAHLCDVVAATLCWSVLHVASHPIRSISEVKRLPNRL